MIVFVFVCVWGGGSSVPVTKPPGKLILEQSSVTDDEQCTMRGSQSGRDPAACGTSEPLWDQISDGIFISISSRKHWMHTHTFCGLK